MPIAGNAVIGRVKPDPSMKWDIGFYPGMGSAFAPEFMIFRTNITADITGGNSNAA